MKINLKNDLKQSLRQEAIPLRIEETKQMCLSIMEKQPVKETRTNFVQFFSDIFRFESLSVLGLQAVTLFIVCLIIGSITDSPSYIPVFMPLFVLAVMPSVFKGVYYQMSEIEAVTRASVSQIILAKLILAGGANLVCITVLIGFEVFLQNSCREIGQLILYCIVPYLGCMTGMLRIMRSSEKKSIPIGVSLMLSACAAFGILAKKLPWLYESSAVGIWIASFLFFAVFFAKEILYIVIVRKEGKMYGIIS